MKPWLRAHFDAFADALGRLLAAPLSSLLALLAIGIALALPTGGLVLLDNLRALGTGLAGSHEISLFLTPDATAADVRDIEQRLRTRLPGQFRFVGKDAALKDLQVREGLRDLLAGLPRNPLPDAFVVRPAEAAAAEFDALAKSFAAWPKVAHVQVDSAWVARLDAVVRFGQLLVALLAAILAAGLVAVVVNTIRLQVLARRDEVDVALLIGATPAFVARPFLWFGIVEGLLGAGVALALVGGALALLAAPAAELFALYGGGFRLRTLDPELALVVVGAGGLLGWCAGWLSTRAIRLT